MAGEMTAGTADRADARILVVEDNPSYADMLRNALQNKYGYQDVLLAENARQALERLDASYFDVIIADMRLGDDRQGGFRILREVKARNITSIVIILTANDNWPDCREAFRDGARDYLSKNMEGNVFKILHQSILEALEYAQKYGSRSDELWIAANREGLLKDYPNRHVAVMNNTVIASDADREILLARIRERGLPLLVPIVEYLAVEDVFDLPVAELIRRPEDGRVEFKRTLRDDGPGRESGKREPSNVLKTIAAFLNAEGGVLLIGVEDDGTVLGLETDYAALGNRPNWDGFNVALTNRIVDSIGAAFMRQYIKIEPHVLEGKEIAVVRVGKASSPAFMGKKYFCIRAGATSRLLDMEETCRYLAGRMKWVLG